MITIGSDTQMPPGGWKLTVEETGQTLQAGYAGSLRKKVNAHREANGLPEMAQAEFEAAACRESGHGSPWCTGVKGTPKPPTTMEAIRRFMKTMLVLARKRKFVAKEEHARRMKICESCPMNSIEGLGCRNCVQDLREVEAEVGTMPNGNILACRACLCICWYKCWLPNDTMDEAEKEKPPAYQEGHCWRLGH